MVTTTLRCRHCQSMRITRNGLTNNGKQRYHCNDCHRNSRKNPQTNGYTPEQRQAILHAYQERSSLRGLTRTFGAARNRVSTWIKKKPTNSHP
ncbi:MAG: IS1 family transposase [Chlorobi bacterium]|nr:IS1 family transposase [Chlorobiota bacterium]